MGQHCVQHTKKTGFDMIRVAWTLHACTVTQECLTREECSVECDISGSLWS